MALLREAGVLGFSDDGKPVVSAGLLRRALQYQRLCGGVISLHEEDPTLSGAGVMHEGPVSAELGSRGSFDLRGDDDRARRNDRRRGGGRVHFQHIRRGARSRRCARCGRPARASAARATPHHLLLTDVAVKDLDTSFKMNPPLRSEGDRVALVEALRDGTIDCIATDHAPHSREEKMVPSKRRRWARSGSRRVRGAVHGPRRAGHAELACLVERLTAAAALFDLATPRSRLAPRRTSASSTSTRAGASANPATRVAPRTAASRARAHGRVLLTLARGQIAYRERTFALSAA